MDNEDAHDIYSSVEVFFCFVLFCFIFFFKNDNVEEGTVFFTVISLIIFYLFHLPLPSRYFSRTLPSNC